MMLNYGIPGGVLTVLNLEIPTAAGPWFESRSEKNIFLGHTARLHYRAESVYRE